MNQLQNPAFDDLATPCVLVDVAKLERNIEAMQARCDAHGVELWPHIKTHKLTEVGRRQLEAGARGFTCAKLGEAEALLPCGVRRIFIAHSLGRHHAPRLRALHENLDELIVACTSEAHAPVISEVANLAGLELPVMMALDTGLGREGARTIEDAVRLAQQITRLPHLKLIGIYTHEGHLYTAPTGEADDAIAKVHQTLLAARDAIQNATGMKLKLWPGCSVSAFRMAALPGVDALRPGASVFGDLYLSRETQVMDFDDIALTVLATVIDRPEPNLALIDAGSKVFSSDRTPESVFAESVCGRSLLVTRLSEEHGFIMGDAANALQIGDRVRFAPAHVCPVVNLTERVWAVRGEEVVAEWMVEARGCVR